MVKKRSVDRIPCRANESKEFPNFSGWLRLILLYVVTLMLLGLVIYPLDVVEVPSCVTHGFGAFSISDRVDCSH
ncbi:hypothetical protein Poly41_27050 [Novipirellula artificiosorum]|uniref:Uncharacterized protein n=1 Tax=Novipirellula artificiosorum TaxID=2528016 RepID=A0A5C6DTX3_9BACT|nr:hypothetical protein Poly41_27050 [Novipirellula artificiosorum]